jgi:hypothetical protein
MQETEFREKATGELGFEPDSPMLASHCDGVEKPCFTGDFSKIASNGILSALGRYCQYSCQILTKNRGQQRINRKT